MEAGADVSREGAPWIPASGEGGDGDAETTGGGGGGGDGGRSGLSLGLLRAAEDLAFSMYQARSRTGGTKHAVYSL